MDTPNGWVSCDLLPCILLYFTPSLCCTFKHCAISNQDDGYFKHVAQRSAQDQFDQYLCFAFRMRERALTNRIKPSNERTC